MLSLTRLPPLFFAFLFAACCHAYGDSTVDPVFGGSALGLLGGVTQVALQADGKVLVAGGHNGVTRLNADGSTDTGFRARIDRGRAANAVYAVAVQADGKVLVGGNFAQVNGTDHANLARLNADGSVDAGFNPGADDNVGSFAVQPDGKIVIGGNFTQVNGTTHKNIARLNTDGTVDASFVGSVDAGIRRGSQVLPSFVVAVSVQSDGKILLTGNFSKVDATRRDRVARLNADGSLDNGFAPDLSIQLPVLVRQDDGKYLVGGKLPRSDGSDYDLVFRLNADGSRDGSFGGIRGNADTYVHSLAIQANGGVIASQTVETPGAESYSVARLNGDGSVDATFSVSLDGEGGPLIQPDGKILLAGGFTKVNGVPRNSLARVDPTGALDPAFVPDVASGPNAVVRALAVQPDGKIVLAGDFSEYNGVFRDHLARLKADGSLDTGFAVSMKGPVATVLVSTVATQSDGKVLLGGGFTQVNGVARAQLARLNTDGSLDTGFNVSVYDGGNGVQVLVVQPDGKILVIGTVYQANGQADDRFVRLNADGSPDPGFSAHALNSDVITLQPDGKILCHGDDPVDYSQHIFRLNADGGADNAFHAVAMSGCQVMAVQPDGKIIVGGSFNQVDGVARTNLARLNADGSLDAGFNASADGVVYLLVVQPDGKIVVGGDFGQVNGAARNYLAHLNADGSLDPFYNLESGADGPLNVLVRQPDGKVMVAGDFTTMNGALRNYVARLKASGTPDFFSGQVAVGGGFYYLEFPGGSPFGYYNLQGNGYGFPFVYHNDLGMEYFFDAQDGQGGAYFYDFASSTFFYTSPSFPWPYLYDFSLKTVLYYYPDSSRPDHYNTNGVRYFFNFATGQIITK